MRRSSCESPGGLHGEGDLMRREGKLFEKGGGGPQEDTDLPCLMSIQRFRESERVYCSK